jgi:hypothetical protein
MGQLPNHHHHHHHHLVLAELLHLCLYVYLCPFQEKIQQANVWLLHLNLYSHIFHLFLEKMQLHLHHLHLCLENMK